MAMAISDGTDTNGEPIDCRGIFILETFLMGYGCCIIAIIELAAIQSICFSELHKTIPMTWKIKAVKIMHD